MANEEKVKPRNHYILNEKDSLALLDIYKKANGRYWANWDFSNIETWNKAHGEIIFGKDSLNMEYRVTGLYLPPLAFGTLSPKIGDLTELEQLSIGGAGMGAVFPKEISKLKKLYKLSIIRTNFESYPDEIFQLPSMKFFEIYYSPINQPVPSAIKYLPKNSKIAIVGCGLSGNIPLEILEREDFTVSFAENNITELPWEVWKDDKKLCIPEMTYNRLSGSVPDWVKNTNKWKEHNRMIDNQQDEYGYTY